MDTGGTSLQGTIRTTYYDLVECFGNPITAGICCKSDAEWKVEFSDGTIATIYNWKNGHSHCGFLGLSVEDIKEWNIGGFTLLAVEKVVEKLTNGSK